MATSAIAVSPEGGSSSAEKTHPELNVYELRSGRWFGYLLLGIVGSIVGVMVIGVIVLLGIYFTSGPVGVFLAVVPLASGLTLWMVLLPAYALFCAFLGLLMAKGHAMRAFDVRLERDTPLAKRVAEIARAAGLERAPDVGVFSSPDANAFATGSGRNNSLVAFTSTLLERCTDEEIDAIAAHEVGHIASNDMLAMTLLNGIQNGMSWMMGIYGLRMLVRNLIFFVTELGAKRLSRSREYRADAISAALVGREHMIAGLQRLQGSRTEPPARLRGYRMQMFAWPSLSTHPPIPERIRALESERYVKKLPFKGRQQTIL